MKMKMKMKKKKKKKSETKWLSEINCVDETSALHCSHTDYSLARSLSLSLWHICDAFHSPQNKY